MRTRLVGRPVRGLRPPEEQFDAATLAEWIRAGGLYLLSYHSQLLARPDLVPALANLARTIAGDGRVWRTTAGDVAAWWRAKADVRVTARRDSGNVVTVSVTNQGATPVSDAVVRVVLGPGERAAESELRLLAAPPGVARLALPRIGPGESRTTALRVTPPER